MTAWRRRCARFGGAALIALMSSLPFGLSLPEAAASAQPRDDTASACVTAWGEARYVVGYDHIVHLVNRCSVDAECTVTTDVNPEAHEAAVPAGAHVTVTTWLGSPTSRFTPSVTCRMKAPR